MLLNELNDSLAELDEFPYRWPALPNSIRAVRMKLSKRLQYYIFYHIKEKEISVLHILPQSANPTQWPSDQ